MCIIKSKPGPHTSIKQYVILLIHVKKWEFWSNPTSFFPAYKHVRHRIYFNNKLCCASSFVLQLESMDPIYGWIESLSGHQRNVVKFICSGPLNTTTSLSIWISSSTSKNPELDSCRPNRSFVTALLGYIVKREKNHTKLMLAFPSSNQ